MSRSALVAALIGAALVVAVGNDRRAFGAAPLTADTHEVSISAGGGPKFTLTAGAAHANLPYLLVGSMSGTSPGLRIGGITVPLNWDAYTSFLDNHPNLLIENSFANLDAAGNGTAKYRLPPGLVHPMWLGLRMHHAYVVFGKNFSSFKMASNPVPLTLVK